MQFYFNTYNNTLKHNNILKFIQLFLLFSIIVGINSGCSTRKNTPTNRAWHNMTSRFNVNFNGKEALKQGEEEYKKLCKDNYINTLPIYYYPPKEEITSIYPTMDRVIAKASKSIYKHSMFFKGKEYVKPIDDAYLMMGKAYFYKQDYIQAQRIFSYIVSTHKNGNCIEEAMVWNARCAMQQNYFVRADEIINEAKYYIQNKKSKKLNVLYAAAGAEYQMRAPDGETETAINYLDDILKNHPKKDLRARTYFILGQLYEKMEQPREAKDYFLLAIKKSTSYEMEFNARMHLAANYDGTPASKEQILKELNKMLKEEKNLDFKDQIYYAMSEIDRIDDDTTARIKNLAKSVAAYQNNDYQRTYSSLQLADLYMDKEQYPQAKAYYDTATLSLPKNYPNYDAIMKKAEILTDLVDNLQCVVVEDSLQRIAKMSEKDRNRWVQNKIAEYKREKERQKREEEAVNAALQSSLGYANINSNLNNNNSGKWYFYNSTLMSAGKTEFLRRWGARKLEDNWRISNKQQISFDDLAALNDPNAASADTSEYDEDGNLIVKRETDPEKERYYTQDLPLTPGAIDTSNEKIANALYQAAIIYLDLLNDRKRGCETLEKFYERFPDHELTPSALYLLYRNYPYFAKAKAETPKNIILTKYADTDYARLINEPDYYAKLAAKNKEMETKYEVVYADFANKQWKKVIAAAEEAIPLCNNEELKSKYAYLRAVAIGQVKGEKELISALQAIIADYAKYDVAELARIYLSNFNAPEVAPAETAQNEQNTDEKEAQKQSAEAAKENPFAFAPDDWHYISLIVNVHKCNVQNLKTLISDFNKEYYSLQKLTLNSFYINQDEQIVSIARFRGKDAAMDYYHAIQNNDKFKADILAKNITVYPMSSANYGTFYKQKDSRNAYEEFFNTYYLNK